MKTFLLFFLCTFTSVGIAQVDTLTFKEFALEQNTFINNAGEGMSFRSGGIILPNSFEVNNDFEAWSGWSLSTMMDTSTAGFTNQYSVISGYGANQSSGYGVSFGQGGQNYVAIDHDSVASIIGLYVNNSTYAYLSMLNGDQFAKRFGGVDGSDPDYLKLSISGIRGATTLSDTIDFYLADYRAESPEEDYIVREWTYIDLSSLGDADTLVFSLETTDIGQFGPNTPLYFCIDDIVFEESLSTNTESEKIEAIGIYPNPTTDNIFITNPNVENAHYTIFHLSTGVQVQHGTISSSSIRIHDLSSGSYLIEIRSSRKIYRQKLVKN